MSALTAYAARVLAARKDGTTVEVWLGKSVTRGVAARLCDAALFETAAAAEAAVRSAGRELVAVVPVAAIEQLDLVDWLNSAA